MESMHCKFCGASIENTSILITSSIQDTKICGDCAKICKSLIKSSKNKKVIKFPNSKLGA